MFSCVFSEGQEKRLHPLTLRLFNPGGRKEIESILKTIGDREGKKSSHRKPAWVKHYVHGQGRG